MKLYQITTILFGFSLVISSSSCSNRTEEADGADRFAAPQVEQFIKVVPRDFFSGIWRAANADTKISIDMKKEKFVTVGGVEMTIEDAVPVDTGYALLRYAPEYPDHPDELYQVVVLKKLDENTIALIFSSEMMSVFVRDGIERK